ncbi:MAG: hypothetical protein Q3961_03885, partial [Bifidobacteriaceae bacterium]|nr:hypothetical protein [Bifidobacteriaceae bacterium]
IGITRFFESTTLSWISLNVFITVILLFFIYILEVEYHVDNHKTGVTGNGANYFHYLILFGLSFITISFEIVGGNETNMHYTAFIFYFGFTLMLVGVLLMTHYNKHEFSVNKCQIILISITLICAYLFEYYSHASALLRSSVCMLSVGLILAIQWYAPKLQKKTL